MSNLCGIYKITSPSGKIYIGESVNINKRWLHYKGLHCKRQPILYNSLSKYGPENHKFEIIELCNIDELKCKERYYQEFYNVIGEKGLNSQLTECGEKKQVHTEETKRKISEALKGRVFSKESLNKMRESSKNFVFTEEHRKKISIANSGKGNAMYGKKGHLSPNFGRKGLSGKDHPHYGKKGPAHHSWGRSISKEHREKIGKKASKLSLDFSNGIFYESCIEASFALCIPVGRLRNYLSGNRRNKTTLEYV